MRCPQLPRHTPRRIARSAPPSRRSGTAAPGDSRQAPCGPGRRTLRARTPAHRTPFPVSHAQVARCSSQASAADRPCQALHAVRWPGTVRVVSWRDGPCSCRLQAPRLFVRVLPRSAPRLHADGRHGHVRGHHGAVTVQEGDGVAAGGMTRERAHAAVVEGGARCGGGGATCCGIAAVPEKESHGMSHTCG
jgi:hypothetical protein